MSCCNELHADHVCGDLPGGGAEDEEVPVHGHQEDGEGREENTSRLKTTRNFTEISLQYILMSEENG